MRLFTREREGEPKHRSILNIKTIKTPRQVLKKVFDTDDLTSFDNGHLSVSVPTSNTHTFINNQQRYQQQNHQQQQQNHQQHDPTLAKTKLLVDTSLKGEVERNLILEQQLYELSEATSMAYDEIYSLKQELSKMSRELAEKDDIIQLQKTKYHDSISTITTMNSMISGRKSVSTTNTSIHHHDSVDHNHNNMHTHNNDNNDNDKDKELEAQRQREINMTQQISRLEKQLIQMKYQLTTTQQDSHHEIIKLQKIINEKELQIQNMNNEYKQSILNQNDKLNNYKNVIWQLSRNHNYLQSTDV